MPDKNFKGNSYPLNENKFLPNNNENQLDGGAETLEKHSCPDLEKPEKFEKFKKNFSKTLAASLAILNLFSGNFNLAKAANTSKDDSITAKIDNEKDVSNSIKTNVGDRKKKDLPKINAKSTNGEEVKVNQNNWITKKRVGIGSVVLAALFGAYVTKERWWPKSDGTVGPVFGNAATNKVQTSTNESENKSHHNNHNSLSVSDEVDSAPDNSAELEEEAKTWLDNCGANKDSKDHWLQGIDLVQKLIAHLRNSFRIEFVEENNGSDLNGSLKVKNNQNNRCIFIRKAETAGSDVFITAEDGNFAAEDFLGSKFNMFIFARDILVKLEDTFDDELFGTENFPFVCVSGRIQNFNFNSLAWQNYNEINGEHGKLVFTNMFNILRDTDGVYNERLETLRRNLKENNTDLTLMLREQLLY